MKELVTTLLMWLAQASDRPVDVVATLKHPQIVFADVCETVGLDLVQGVPCTVEGAYNHELNRLVLPADWSRDDPHDVSDLVHELTHFLQDEVDRSTHRAEELHRYDLHCALEQEAYRLAAVWLSEERGLDYTYRAMQKSREACRYLWRVHEYRIQQFIERIPGI